MSQRQSARKVKFTSKFEEFSTSRFGNVQRSAHPDVQNTQQDVSPQKAEKIVTPKVEREQPKESEQNHQAKVPETPARERSANKVLRHKAAASTPALNQSYEPIASPYGHMTPLPKLTANGKVRGRPRKCWQKAETTVKPMSSTREELLRLREENANLKIQLEQRTAEHEDLKRQSSYTGQTVPKVDFDDLKEKYQRDLIHAKRHEWCAVCLNPSRYYCCWNTTYCSQKCQVSDWYQRHIKSCERRRALKTVS